MNTRNFAKNLVILTVFGLLASCSGGSSAPPVAAPPTAAITAQPTDQSVVAGATATFTVVATGATGYQWQFSTNNGSSFTDVAGATSASYTTPVTLIGDNAKQYRVQITGAGNVISSTAVTLTVTAAPVAPSISAHPVNQTIVAGQNVSFSVTASGTTPAYQWQRSTDGGTIFNNIANTNTSATTATLDLTAVPLSDNGHQFRVLVSNSLGSLTSNAGLLAVNAAPAIPAFTQHPANVTITAGQNPTFTVAVIGTPAPTLQWQVSSDNGVSFTNIVGATGVTYTAVGAALAANGRQFRAVATNTSGSTTSTPATLTVNPAPAGVWGTMIWNEGNWG